MKFIVTFCFLFFAFTLLAQETIVTGKVTEASSSDPIPFVNVFFKGSSVGATTDFDGRFTVRTCLLCTSDAADE